MYLVGRVAKGFGCSPLMLASEYGLIAPSFLDGLLPEEKILADNHLLNRLIEAENEAHEKAREEAKERTRLPGVTRMVSAAERSEQLREMRAKKDD